MPSPAVCTGWADTSSSNPSVDRNQPSQPLLIDCFSTAVDGRSRAQDRRRLAVRFCHSRPPTRSGLQQHVGNCRRGARSGRSMAILQHERSRSAVGSVLLSRHATHNEHTLSSTKSRSHTQYTWPEAAHTGSTRTSNTHGGGTPALGLRRGRGCRLCWMVVDCQHGGSRQHYPAHGRETVLVSETCGFTAAMRRVCVASDRHRAMSAWVVCWVHCSKHRRQLGWCARRTGLSRHAETHLAAHVQHAALLHQVLGFWSDMDQKLRTDLSFPALPCAVSTDDVFIFFFEEF